MQRPLIALVSLVLAGASVTSGCAAAGDSDGQELRVAAAFYPLQYVAEEVAGDHARVDNLTQPGAEPHDLELTVTETAMIADADLVVYEHGFQPAVDESVEQNAEGQTLDVADIVHLLPVARPGEQDEDAGVDPHFWHDPMLMADLGDRVASTLAELDPDHARDYEANATALRRELDRLDAAFRRGLAHCERDTVVVSHDAFEYLAKYGLHLEPIAGLSPDAEPTPADLERLEQLVADEGITTVFSETLASPKLAQTLAADAGVRSAVLDPIEGLSDRTEGEDYGSLMTANLRALKEANGC